MQFWQRLALVERAYAGLSGRVRIGAVPLTFKSETVEKSVCESWNAGMAKHGLCRLLALLQRSPNSGHRSC
jgi:hypothetical protein